MIHAAVMKSRAADYRPRIRIEKPEIFSPAPVVPQARVRIGFLPKALIFLSYLFSFASLAFFLISRTDS